MLQTVREVAHFIFGGWHPVIGSVIVFLFVNFGWDFIEKKNWREPWQELVKKVLAYISFIVIGNQLDLLMVDHLFGWVGSTHFLVALCLLAREVRVILTRWNKMGIETPAVLDNRIAQVTQGHTTEHVFFDHAAIEKKMAELKENMEKLKELQELEEQTNKALQKELTDLDTLEHPDKKVGDK